MRPYRWDAYVCLSDDYYQVFDRLKDRVTVWRKLPMWAREGRRFSICFIVSLIALGCSGQISDREESPEARYARDACECATDPGCDPTAIVAGFAAGTPDEACVTAYADAMETRITCMDVPTMPTCALFETSPAAERYARAVCACGGDRPGCYANALGEVRGGNPACLDMRAAGYEVDCTGRTGQECVL